MQHNLDKFMQKMKKEAIIKSLICGISSALLIMSLWIILCKIIPIQIIIWLNIVLFIVLSIGATLAFLKYVFTIDMSKVAQRLEKNANLEERVKTMVEFEKEDSPMIQLQRKDTNEKLNALPVSTLKMKFSFSNFVMTILAGIALTGAILIPPSEVKPSAANPSDSASESPFSSEEPSSLDESSPNSDGGSEQNSGSGEGENNDNQGIQDAINQMQQEVNDNTGLNDPSKEEVNQDLEDLKDKLTNPDSNNQNSGEQIDQSKEDINQKLDDQITKDDIGQALQNQDTTQQVGESVSNGDTQQTSNSLDDLRNSLNDLTGDELANALNQIAQDIDNALNESNVDSSDPLYQAFEHLSTNLKEDASHVNDDDIQNQIDQSFEQAKEEINNALNDQNAIEDLKDSLNQQLDDLKEQLGNGNQGENKDPNDSQDPNSGNQSGGNGEGAGSGDIIYSSDDLIYDPLTGKYVTYGEIIAYYYSQVIDGMEESEIPEDLEKLIYDYFSSLYFDGNK